MNNIPFGKPLVKREKTRIERDTSRVITRALIPSIARIKKIINRVLELTEKDAESVLQEVHISFFNRHKNIESKLEKHFNKVSVYLPTNEQLSKTKKMLIGAYFTM
ncbi:MAG: glycosidase, partial [Candidatus Paceibacterota bacterium]